MGSRSPLIMRPKILAVIFALLVPALSGGTTAGALSPARTPVVRAEVGALAVPRDTGAEQYLFDRLNEVRVEAGLPALTRDPALDQIALEWTDHQIPQGHISHRTDLADQVETRITLDWRRIGENVGWGPSAEWLHDGFWNSAPHRANMLGDYNRVGIGARLEADGDVWVTVNFLKGPDLPAVVAPGPSGPGPDVEAWSVTPNGEVTPLGGAPWFGDLSDLTLARPIVALESTPSGNGYWLAASDGGIFAFGDARFFGSTGNINLNRPIVGMAATPTGNGYWLAASDGGIFAFGDARFFGSTGDIELASPITDMGPTADGNGYWLVAEDGGVFTFGNARYTGSAGAVPLPHRVVGMAPGHSDRSPQDMEYWLVTAGGSVMGYGDAPVSPSAVLDYSGRIVTVGFRH